MAASVAAPAGAKDDVRAAAQAPAAAPTADSSARSSRYGLYDDALAEAAVGAEDLRRFAGAAGDAGLIYSRKGDLRRGINA